MESTLDELNNLFREKHGTALVLMDCIMEAENNFEEKWEAEEIRLEIQQLHNDRDHFEKFSPSRGWYDMRIAKLTREKEKLEEALKKKVYALPDYTKLKAVRLEALELKEELKERFRVHASMCMYWPY